MSEQAALTRRDQGRGFNNLGVATKKAMLSGAALILLYTFFALKNPLFFPRV